LARTAAAASGAPILRSASKIASYWVSGLGWSSL
jgi:hypothetical protein